MPDRHQEKYITKLLFCFAFVTAGILLILYTAFERSRTDNWYFWGIIAATLINAGLYFLKDAIVHKVKSDLIKRQKLKDQQKSFTIDE